MTPEQKNEAYISGLRGSFQPIAREIIRIADEYVFQRSNGEKRVRAINGIRTIAQQNRLYALGRTTPGRIVTFVSGGYSWHNYGLAVDIGVFSRLFETYYGSDPLIGEIGEVVAASLGSQHVIWGGHFPTYFPGSKFRDMPHYEWHPGYAVAGGVSEAYHYAKRPFDLPLFLPTPMPDPMPKEVTLSAEDAINLQLIDQQTHDIRARQIALHKEEKELEDKLSILRAQEREIIAKLEAQISPKTPS